MRAVRRVLHPEEGGGRRYSGSSAHEESHAHELGASHGHVIVNECQVGDRQQRHGYPSGQYSAV